MAELKKFSFLNIFFFLNVEISILKQEITDS